MDFHGWQKESIIFHGYVIRHPNVPTAYEEYEYIFWSPPKNNTATSAKDRLSAWENIASWVNA